MMHSIRNGQHSAFRIHVSLAATVFLAACAGQPSDMTEATATVEEVVATAPGSCGGKTQAERQKAVVAACERTITEVARCLNDARSCLEELSTQEGACHAALEELACESTDSRELQELFASALNKQRARAERSDSSNVTSLLTNDCPGDLYWASTSGSCNCPPLSSFGRIWGTGVYTNDSHLCTAAVHSGIITASAGGQISYTLLPGRGSYCASTQNGVTSSGYGYYGSSYSVGGAELTLVQRESVSHTYTARNISTNTVSTFSAGSSCLAKPVSIMYVDANEGDLLAVGNDGTQQVIDASWGGWDSYSPISTTRSDCEAVCPR